MTYLARASLWRRAAHRLVVAVLLAWTVAALSPCVMATPMSEHDRCPEHAAATADMAEHCGTAALDCQLPDANVPIALAPDLPVYGAALLARLPVVKVAPPIAAADRPNPSRFASHPPPYLAFAVLLI